MGPWLPVRSDKKGRGMIAPGLVSTPRVSSKRGRGGVWNCWSRGESHRKFALDLHDLPKTGVFFPSRNQNMAMEIPNFLDGFPIETSIFRGFPIVTFEYQRVNIIIYPCSWHSFGNVMIKPLGSTKPLALWTVNQGNHNWKPPINGSFNGKIIWKIENFPWLSMSQTTKRIGKSRNL